METTNRPLPDFRVLKQELKIRGFSRQTQKTYLYHNQKFIESCKKSPRQITGQNIKDYIEYLIDKNLAAASVRLAFNSLNFYYTKILKRRFFAVLVLPKRENKTPLILTREEIKRLLEVIANPKHRLLIEFIYSSGLRVSEVVKFKTNDIYPQERIAVVRQSKRKKDRKVILSEKFIEDYGEYRKRLKSNYLFPSRQGHLTARTVQTILKTAAGKAGIKKKIHPHLLRHSFATHLLENKVNLRHIQKLLGHSSIKSTQRYAHISDKEIKKIKSPLDS